MFDDELEDPKVELLNDLEYRVWHAMLNLCNRSPARLRERGYLYHSKGFPVSTEYIARRLAKPVAEVTEAIAALCRVGGESSLILSEKGEGGTVYRIRAWRKRQDGGSEGDIPEKLPESSQANPEMSGPDVDVYQDVDKDKRRKTEGGAPVAKAPSPPLPPRPTWQAESDALRAIPGYPFDADKDRVLMDSLAEAYGQLDLAKEIHRMKAWLAAKGLLPLKGQSKPRQRLRNWVQRADQYDQDGRAEKPGQPVRRHTAEVGADYGRGGPRKF